MATMQPSQPATLMHGGARHHVHRRDPWRPSATPARVVHTLRVRLAATSTCASGAHPGGRRRTCAARASGSPSSHNDPSAVPTTLVLGTAINIASASVGAYLDADEKTGREFLCRGSNKTTTRFFVGPNDLTSKRLRTILQVRIDEVSGFRRTDWFSKPDLYVEVSAGESFARTPPASNTSNPSFAEPLMLFPNHPRGSSLPTAPPPLTVRVFDDDSTSIGKALKPLKTALGRLGVTDPLDDFLGTAEIPLSSDWEAGGATQHTVEIPTRGGRATGTVKLTLTPSPLTCRDDVGRRALDSWANPGLALKPDTPEAMQLHVATATVLHPEVADLAAPPGDAALLPADPAKKPRTPVTAAVTRAKPPADPEGAAGGAEHASTRMKQAQEAVRAVWKTLPKTFKNAFLTGGSPVALLDSAYDTQVWVHSDERLKQVVIAFRGTQADNGWDWFTDALLLPDAVAKDPANGGLRTVGDLRGAAEADGGKRVHHGFYKAYRSVEPQIRQMIAFCTGHEAGPGSKWTITTCGHSLGGALATVCAYDLATSRDIGGAGYAVQSFTFGSPRAGNEEFARAYDEAVPATFRFHNQFDVVAQVPWFFGYTHVRNEARLDDALDDSGADSRRIYLPEDNPISNFGDGVVPPQVREQLVARPGPLDLRMIRKRSSKRLSVVRAVLSGRGTSSHEFDEYVLSLADLMYQATSGTKYARDLAKLRTALQEVREAGAQEEHSKKGHK